ncbi:serine protease inhibitor 42Dd [Drosophila eugracilis]|uniref:serine protease inhibitor 42Dd n=1 Tax=Drosophila eugracilis TaxID=29029 RepID=UPI0007E71803|nr:serine protease inhibitor 42Dd [Drosophila eugracilis]
MHMLLLLLFGISRSRAQKNIQIPESLYAAIVSSFPDQNIIFSTDVIRSSMLFIYVGVENDEAEEIRKALRYEKSYLSQYKPDSKKIFAMRLQNDTIAKSLTRFYIPLDLKMSKNYKRFMRHTEGSAEGISFTPEKLNEVNNLYRREMGDKIGKIVKKSWWKSTNQGLLINAMFFNLTWQLTFNEEATYLRGFRVNENRTIMIPMMHEDSQFAFGNFTDLNATAVRVPFSQGGLGMLLIKPDRPDGLSNLEIKLSGLDIIQISKNLQMNEVFVVMPKFNLSCHLELAPVFKKMGIRGIFSPSKSFSTLLERKTEFRIDGVNHVVSFEFKEQGIGPPQTDVGNGSLTHTVSEVKYFMATHPFAFFIIDQESIFFAGHVTSF